MVGACLFSPMRVIVGFRHIRKSVFDNERCRKSSWLLGEKEGRLKTSSERSKYVIKSRRNLKLRKSKFRLVERYTTKRYTPVKRRMKKMSFSENLQAIRKKNQLSQEELAELLGVSRQAVSKWELGEGYPEVEKLLILSKKLNVSLDSLMTGSVPGNDVREAGRPGIIRIISPNEGVIMDIAKVMRSQEFRGGKNSPKYALFASDGKEMSFSQNTFLGWYRNLDDINTEIEEIRKALDAGAASYVLRYSVKCKQNLFRTIEE